MQLKIEEVLEREGVYVATTAGSSMYPMLRHLKDTIVVTPCKGRLKKYDVALYRSRGKYLLHRVIEVKPDSYVICGDNCIQKEYGIKDKDILGVLTCFHRNGKEVNMNGMGYKIYVWIWWHTYAVRMVCKKIKRKIQYKQGYPMG